MRIDQRHIILLLLVVSTLFIKLTTIDSNFFSSYSSETEIEESYFDIDETESEKDWYTSGSDNGNNAAACIQNSNSHHFISRKSNSLFFESTDLSKRSQLFILYCCLKLDC